MYVRMDHNIPTMNRTDHSWYRKLGLCFDFVTDKRFATDMTEEDADVILEHADFYKKMYAADALEKED